MLFSSLAETPNTKFHNIQLDIVIVVTKFDIFEVCLSYFK